MTPRRTYNWPENTVCLECKSTDGKYHAKGLCEKCRGRKWRKENKDKTKTIAKRSRDKAREDVLNHYGNKCNCCGESQPEFLAIDHINNDGCEHRRKHYKSMYIWVRKNNYPSDLQILCHKL